MIVVMFLSFVGIAYVALADKYIPDDLILAGMSIVFGLGLMGSMVMIFKEEGWNV